MHGCSGLRAALCNRATQYYYINIYIPKQVCNVQGCCINSSHSSAEFQGSKFLQQHSKENILFSSEMIYFHCRNKLFLLMKFTLSSAEWISFFYYEMNIFSCWNEHFILLKWTISAGRNLTWQNWLFLQLKWTPYLQK